jgi:ketosteroid isomerase-like protein
MALSLQKRAPRHIGYLWRTTMQNRCLLITFACLLGLGIPTSVPHSAFGKTQLVGGAIQEVEPSVLKEVLSIFEEAEQAMQARDIEGVMALYSDNYLYHNLTKAEIRKIWSQLFKNYKELESFHSFSVIRTAGPAGKLTVEVTCTGVLWGTSKDTMLRTPVDSWYEEVHYLKKENGRWRIVGNLGGESQPVMPFGVAPHPLF